MTRTIFAAVALSCLAATPAAAAEVSSSASVTDRQLPGNNATPTARELRYCINQADTGSRIRRQTCMTRSEWADAGVDIEAAARHPR